MKPVKNSAMTRKPLYLSYAPTTDPKHHSSEHFFDKLGFKSGEASAGMREAFVVDVRDHVQHLSHRFLHRTANPEAFKIVVSEFLAEYGPVYWGYTKRDHLEEPNILKGFLCPRDSTRANSRLVAVMEGFFNYRAYNLRTADGQKTEANRLATKINFEALTGRKADLDRPSRAIQPATCENHRRKRRRILSESEEPTPSSHTQDKNQTSAEGRTALPIDSSSHQSDANLIIITDDLDTGEAHRRQNTKVHIPSKLTTGPESSAKAKHSGIKNEPLSDDIISRIKLRVKADGHGVSARGPILVAFEVYKTSERLFTALMSERSLKPEVQKKVSQLTVTMNGKEMCCRRDRLDDWAEVCREVRELWDNSPELFDRRFEVDVMLHVDE